MANELVSYSRAGDTFHYRWAARRCLKLINPNSELQLIVVEGSDETTKEGEYVIDVTEYYEFSTGRTIEYYQLKHTTVKEDSPFTLSDLKETIEGFAKRFRQHYGTNAKPQDANEVYFNIITNRGASSTFKDNISQLAAGKDVSPGFYQTLESYTGMAGIALSEFCRILHFQDAEGNYNVQKEDLRTEIAQLLAGSVDDTLLESIVALVQGKVLPDSDGRITKEDILRKFGITFERDLYPAPPIWDDLTKIITSKDHKHLREEIINSKSPIIIHAAGGVGKSVFTRQFIASLSSGSLGIAYDCFGTGTYRNRSTPRHRHRDALVQIANELASQGLCSPLIVLNTSNEADIMRSFLRCLDRAVLSLRKSFKEAQLFVLIDAADNAEMAATEFNEHCFAHELLREKLPDGCQLVMLCRTERIDLLEPNSQVKILPLQPFSEQETFENLKAYYESATEDDGREFHRLTAGNPRVQSNALDVKWGSISKLLESLGPYGTTVEDQIQSQLTSAVGRIKDSIPREFHKNVESVCLGLATLPPHIPIEILAKAASVEIAAVKSFVSDIGRALWLYDDSVQFRDEPTETWFRKTFLAQKTDYEDYLKKLEPLAGQYTYVAECLPLLYLQAEQYPKLIDIALSDELLPIGNAIDARNVRVYRLQFAFKAAIKLGNLKDAIKIAIRAGEEVAGNLRQLDLQQKNIDLLVALQNSEKVQEIAYRRLLKGAWEGSENVFSASLLSSISDYKGEARVFLRSALNWLDIYFKEIESRRDDFHHSNQLQDNDLAEIAFALMNLKGVEDSLDFLNWMNPEAMYRVLKLLTHRLIDLGRFESIDEFLNRSSRNVYYSLAIVSELMQAGHVPRPAQLSDCLSLLSNSRTRVARQKGSDYRDSLTQSIVTFLEACIQSKLPVPQILRVLRHYVPFRASQMVTSDYDQNERAVFLKSLAIRTILTDDEIKLEDILPSSLLKKKEKYDADQDSELRNFKEIVNGLLPWYLLRIRTIARYEIDVAADLNKANQDSSLGRRDRLRRYDVLPGEVASIKVSILSHSQEWATTEINTFYQEHLYSEAELSVHEHINAVRCAYRSSHLTHIGSQLEKTAYERINRMTSSGPEDIADRFIQLSRAVLVKSKADAAVYFENAVEIVSKFGDEISERWSAISSIARAATKEEIGDQIAYRFIRCAEVVGENIREKHFDRSGALILCSRMSFGAGLSALARWSDRHVGDLDELVLELIIELVKQEKISPRVGWSLAKLASHCFLNPVLNECLDKETSAEIKENLFSEAVRLLRIQGCGLDYLRDLDEIGQKYNVACDELGEVLKELNKPAKQNSEHAIRWRKSANTSDIWDEIFCNVDILTASGITTAYNNALKKQELNNYSIRSTFWPALVERVSDEDISALIETFWSLDFVEYYEALDFFKCLPATWKEKVSTKKLWPEVVRRMGQEYAFSLVNRYSLSSIIERMGIDDCLILKLKEGIIKGVAEASDFNDATVFFGFVSLISDLVKTEDAIELLNYSLERFEIHVEPEFGDGLWQSRFHTSADRSENIAGLIWSILGSPKSVLRWRAAHSVRSLCDLACVEVLNGLKKWLEMDDVGAFGSADFPFYNLHARLYLFIAMDRIAIDNAALLKDFAKILQKYVFQPHALIQFYTKRIAIRIESAVPGTFDAELFARILAVGDSPYPVKKEKYEYSVDSYWHESGEIKANKKNYHFGWDFERYWFEPLGDVFAVSRKQIEDLAADVVLKDWNVHGEAWGYKNDPRHYLWSNSSERETWHDHGDYPRTDNLDFYRSYHAMFVVASRLLEKMSVPLFQDRCKVEIVT